MTPHRETWAIVLAGGEGRRLRGWSGRDGAPDIPKQYRRLDGGPTLLRRTLERAAGFAPPSRTIVVVGSHQRRFWEPELVGIPEGNRLVQTHDRGTGVALLAATVLIHLRCPGARIVSFPADHAVKDEAAFADAIEAALAALSADPGRVLLIGVTPDDEADGYGWIVPGESIPGGGHAVLRFEEKPPPRLRAELRAEGALIDTFVMAARTTGVLHLFRTGAPELLDAFLTGLIDGGDSPESIVRVYAGLPGLDLGRDLFPAVTEQLAVCAAPACGWIDLGTPERADRWLCDLAEQESLAPHSSRGRTS